MPRKETLRWSNEEARLVVVKAAELRATEIGIPMKDAIYRAQGIVIAEGRRKPHIGDYFIKVLCARLEQIEKTTPRERLIPAAAVEPPAPPPPPKEPTFMEALRMCANVFAAAIAEQLAPMLAAKANGNGNGANGHDHPALGDIVEQQRHFGALPEKLHRHKVAVVGLKGNQQTEIAKRFPHLDFRWVDNGAKGATVEQVTRHCEATFVMTKFIAHKTDRAVVGDKVSVNGGVSELARCVGMRYPETPTHVAPH